MSGLWLFALLAVGYANVRLNLVDKTNFKLTRVQNVASEMTFTMQCKENYWCGIAFPSTGTAMNGAKGILWGRPNTSVSTASLNQYPDLRKGQDQVVKVGPSTVTTISNTVANGWRTIKFKQAYSTGDSRDFMFSATNALTILWAHASSASDKIAYHGSANRGNVMITWTDTTTFDSVVDSTRFKIASVTITSAKISFHLQCMAGDWCGVGFPASGNAMNGAKAVLYGRPGSGDSVMLRQFPNLQKGQAQVAKTSASTLNDVSMSVTGTWRNIWFSQNCDTGDSNDPTFTTAGSQTLLWAHSGSNSTQILNHGGSNRGFTTVTWNFVSSTGSGAAEMAVPVLTLALLAMAAIAM